MHYEGVLRQKGGGFTEGLGRVFGGLARHIFVNGMKKIAQNKVNQVRQKTFKAGIGLMSDMAKRKNFKQALKSRGKRLLTDVLNSPAPAKKRQKLDNSRPTKNSSRRGRGRARKTRQPRKPDVFD